MATLRELLLRDKNDILYYLSGGAGGTAPRYPYYIDDIIYYDTSPLYSEYLTLKSTPEYQEIILGITPSQKYGCVNNICTPQTNGAYTEPTCAGACKQATSSNSSGIIILAGLVGLAIAIMKGRK